MLTTKDILECHDEIHNVWRLGLQENALSKEAIIAADIIEITKNILNRRGGFVLRLSGVLLCGVTRLYSKKSIIFLTDCQDAISKISLKFNPKENNTIIGKGQRSKRDKKNQQDEIDDETMKLWQNEANLENIIELERRDESHKIQSKLTLIDSPETNTSPNVHSQFEHDNDFGNVPFEINVDQNNDDDPIEIPLDLPANDEDFHFSGSDDMKGHEDNEELPVPFEIEANQKLNIKKKKYIIDIMPIIPMTQLSAILEDASNTLCTRPIMNTIFREKPEITSFEFEDLINEVKKLAIQLPKTTLCNTMLTTSDVGNEINEEFSDAPEFPGNNENTYNDNFICGMENQIENGEKRENEVITKIEINLLSELNQSFQTYEEVPLLDVVTNHTRRSLALSFFTALSLKNRAIVDIVQSSKLSVSLIKGKY